VGTLTLRPASAADVEAIVAVHRGAWSEGYRGIASTDALPGEDEWSERLAETLAGEDPGIFVAEREGEVRGFVRLGPSRDTDAGRRTGEVTALYVDPGAWRSGIGAALLDRGERELRMRGFKEVTVWAFERHMRSRSFYEALGYRHDGATQRRLRHENAGEIRYRKPL